MVGCIKTQACGLPLFTYTSLRSLLIDPSQASCQIVKVCDINEGLVAHGHSSKRLTQLTWTATLQYSTISFL